MIISMIVAHGNDRQIGLDNKMLWHIKEDFKHFKETTLGHHLIMGRKTFESIGKPLPGRTTIVVTRNIDFSYPEVFVAHSCEEALEIAKNRNENEVMICGGANLYEQFLAKACKIYISKIDFDGKADTFFPKLFPDQWQLLEEYPHFSARPAISPAWKLQVWERLF